MFHIIGIIWGGAPQKPPEFIKNFVCILTCLSFTHLQSTLHLMQYTFQDVFSTAQNSFWTCPFGCLVVLLQFFFTSSTLAKHFPLRTFFIQGYKKKSLGEIWWIERVGHRGHAIFGQKLLNTQYCVGRCICKSPISWIGHTRWVFRKIQWSWM